MAKDKIVESITDENQDKPKKNSNNIVIVIAFIITWAAILVSTQFNYNQIKERNSTNQTIYQQIKEINNNNFDIVKQISLNTQTINSLTESFNDIEKLQKAIADIPNHIKTPEDQNKADKKDLISLTNKLIKIEENFRNFKNEAKREKNLTLIPMTIIKLKEKIEASRDYTIEFDLIKRLTANNPQIQEYLNDLHLSLEAETATIETIRSEFSKLSKHILSQEEQVEKQNNNPTSSDNTSFWDNVTASLSDGIKIKKIETKEKLKTGLEVKISNIKMALVKGDINTAIKKSGELTGRASKIIKQWREKLKRLYKRELILQNIYQQSKQLANSESLSEIAPSAETKI